MLFEYLSVTVEDEYKEIGDDYKLIPADQDGMLAARGVEGWELVGFTPWRELGDGRESRDFIFKRELNI